MVSKVANNPKKYTVADVYKEAAQLLREEMTGVKKGPLNASEEIKMAALAKMISKTVLKEMNVI
jgi:hypothetical protein